MNRTFSLVLGGVKVDWGRDDLVDFLAQYGETWPSDWGDWWWLAKQKTSGGRPVGAYVCVDFERAESQLWWAGVVEFSDPDLLVVLGRYLKWWEEYGDDLQADGRR